jgi:alkylation response protein AidB-like acyl-CoA dehydrogenase
VNLELSEDQQLLAETVRRFLAERAPIGWVRTMLDDDRGVTDDVWSALVDLGVTNLLDGGGSTVDAGIVAMEMGRALFPGPWLSSAVGAASLVPGLGDRVGTVAFDGLDHVADATAAQVLVVVDGDRASLVEDFSVEPVPTIDGTRKWGRVTVNGSEAALPDADVALARDRVVAATVADGVGAAERALELSVAYAKERVQFDRPIGAFQAVQHLCADMLERVELARSGALYALWACDAADPAERRRAVAMAKAYASEALPPVGADAIQVHGGLGYTWEHDAQLYYKRLLTLEQAYGSAGAHLDALADVILPGTARRRS